MTILGGILMFVAIGAVSKVADWKPEPDRAWILEVIRLVNALIFFGGLMLFGNAIKREAVDELQARSVGPGGPT